MATSPNFNWPEPDNTDLVKNGALAIRTAVNAIDNSLYELKGGTTGQVLSKTSATDMDFTWVTTDDANAIQNAIVDAKGDLIAATANDTPARLAVGTNGQLLSADSTAATGLAWSYGGTSTAYTPTWGVESGTAPTIGNGTLGGFYSRVGDLVFFQVSVLFGSTTTAGSGTYTFGIPFAMSNSAKGFTGSAQILDTGVAWYRGFTPVSVQGGFTNKFTLISDAGVAVSNTTPIVFATGDTIYAWGVYNV
jgi:hypothetical protein